MDKSTQKRSWTFFVSLIKPSDSESEIWSHQKKNVLFLLLSLKGYPWASNNIKAMFKVVSLEIFPWDIYLNIILFS